jgi:hypothetical protein
MPGKSAGSMVTRPGAALERFYSYFKDLAGLTHTLTDPAGTAQIASPRPIFKISGPYTGQKVQL